MSQRVGPRLFERLETALSGSRRRSYALRTDDVFESIREHIREIFSVRQGAVEARPDYGLPDLAAIYGTQGDQAREVCRQLRHAIEQFEPRLQEPDVELRGSDNLQLLFKVSGWVEVDGDLQALEFNARLDERRRMVVQP